MCTALQKTSLASGGHEAEATNERIQAALKATQGGYTVSAQCHFLFSSLDLVRLILYTWTIAFLLETSESLLKLQVKVCASENFSEADFQKNP